MIEDPLYLWRLAPQLSVVDAAILLAGGDPSVTDPEREGIGLDYDYVQVKRTTLWSGFTPAFTAIKAAIMRKELPAKLRYKGKMGGELFSRPDHPFWIVSPDQLTASIDPSSPWKHVITGSESIYIEVEPDWDATSVDVVALRAWLQSRGLSTGFFFPTQSAEDLNDFMNPDHDHFAPELDLAVKAWRALSSVRKTPGGATAAIRAWLDANPEAWAGDGAVSNECKERIKVVVNWNKRGGPDKTGS